MGKYQINYEAADADENKKDGVPYSDFIEISETITGIMLALIVVLTFVFRAAAVSGDAMAPGISDGDRIIVNRYNYTPAKGDIVLVDKVGLGDSKLRRIVAVGGDTVTVNYNTGKLSVNGSEVEEGYLAPYDIPEILGNDFSMTVPGGHFFVLGDNRANHNDSRSDSVGCVTDEDIEGVAVFRIWPADKLGPIE